MTSLGEPEPESGDAGPQATANGSGPTPAQLIAALLSGQPLDQLLPLYAVPPLDTSPGPTGPNPLAPFPEGKGVTRTDARSDSPSPLGGRGARGEGPPDVLIDAEADPDAHLRETDEYLAQRGIAPAGALRGYVEAVRAGALYTCDGLWRAMPGLQGVWDSYRLLILDELTAALGARARQEDPGRAAAADAPPAVPTSARPRPIAEPVDGWIERGDLVWLYRQEIWSLPRLSHEQVVKLAQERDAGNRAALDEIVTSNLRLAAHLAWRYRGHGLELPDLIQEGSIGLMRAARKFDWQLGYQFSTYATWWIRQAITRAIADQSQLVRLPVHMYEQVEDWRKLIESLDAQLGRPPTRAEVAAALGCAAEHVSELEQAAQINDQLISLEAFLAERLRLEERDSEDGELADEGPSVRSRVDGLPSALVAEDESEQAERWSLHARVSQVLGALSQRERTVICLRYGFDRGREWTLEEVGRRFGVTRERIRQIEAKALKKLSHPTRSYALEAYRPFPGRAMPEDRADSRQPRNQQKAPRHCASSTR